MLVPLLLFGFMSHGHVERQTCRAAFPPSHFARLLHVPDYENSLKNRGLVYLSEHRYYII
jgi:hypothetical protein